MKKKQLRFVTLFLALMVSATILPVDIYCAEDAATIDPSRKGSIIIEYFSNDDKTPVAGAGFIFRRIAVPATDRFEPDGTLNGIIWASLLGTLEINEYTDIKTILKTADEVYVNGDPKNGGKTYSGVTDIEGRLILDGIEQGLYVAEEIGSAKGYLESEPFVFSIPYVAQKPSKGIGTGYDFQITPDRYHTTGPDGQPAGQAGQKNSDEPDQDVYGIGDSDELSFDETSEAINQIIGGQASDQQYWNYVINAQPKTRKEQETTTPETKTPETKTPETKTPNTTNPSLEETTEERPSEAESTEVTEPESTAAETTGAESTEPIYQPDTSVSESETEVETSGYESTPETTNDTGEQETEPTKPYEGKKRDGTVKTGDRSMTWLFVSVCLISVGAATILAAVIAERRRRRDEKA